MNHLRLALHVFLLMPLVLCPACSRARAVDVRDEPWTAEKVKEIEGPDWDLGLCNATAVASDRAVTGHAGRVGVWRLDEETVQSLAAGRDDLPFLVGIDAGRQRFVVVWSDAVRCASLETMTTLWEVKTGSWPPIALNVGKDIRVIYGDGVFQTFDVESGTTVSRLETRTKPRAAAFAGEDRAILSLGSRLREFRWRDAAAVGNLGGLSRWIDGIAVDERDGSVVAIAAAGAQYLGLGGKCAEIGYWPPGAREPAWRVRIPRTPSWELEDSIALSSEGGWIAVKSRHGIRFLSLESGRNLAYLPGPFEQHAASAQELIAIESRERLGVWRVRPKP